MSRKKRKKIRIAKHSQAAPSKRPAFFIILAGFVFALFAYGIHINDGLLYEDGDLIYMTAHLAATDFLTLLGPQAATFWRPVSLISFVPDALIWGFTPAGFHLTSLVLHLLCTWLLFQITRRLLTPTFAALGAGLFCLMPINAGAVLWISARVELFCVAFVLGSCLLYLKSLISLGRGAFLSSLLLFAFALFTKETAVITPFLITVLAIFYGPGDSYENLRSRFFSVVWFFAVCAVLVATKFFIAGLPDFASLTDGPVGIRTTFFNYLWSFPAAFLAPLNLSVGGFKFRFVLSVLGWCILVGMVLFRYRKRLWPGLLFGIIACAPIAPFVRIGPNLENSRMLYLGAAGFSIFVAAMASLLYENKGRFHRVLLFGIGAWAFLLVPVLFLNGSAYRGASIRADKMRTAIKTALGKSDPGGPVYCRDFIHSYKGVPIFHPRQFSRIALPVAGQVAPETVILVDENFLIENPSLLPFRDAVAMPGISYLVWDQGNVTDKTIAAGEAMSLWANASPGHEMNLEVMQPGSHIIEKNRLVIELKPPEGMPGGAIENLSLKMSLVDDKNPAWIGYVVEWEDKQENHQLNLLYRPDDNGWVHIALDKDPEWSMSTEIISLSISPGIENGSARIESAKISYLAHDIVIEEEMVLDLNLLLQTEGAGQMDPGMK